MAPVFLLASAAAVPSWVTILFCVLLVGLISCLALEEVLHAKKSIIAGAFAIICLLAGTATGIFSFEEVVVGSHQAKVNNDVSAKYSDENEHTYEVEIASTPGSDHGARDSNVIHIGGHEISMPFYIPGIDWSVIAIILGSSLFVDVTSRSGLFSWIAITGDKVIARGSTIFVDFVRRHDGRLFRCSEQCDCHDHRGFIDGCIVGETGAARAIVAFSVD